MGFEKWVSTKVGQLAYSKLKDTAKKNMFQDFEYQIKRGFDPVNQQEYSVGLKGVEDNEDQGISDDTILVKLYADQRNPL